MKTSRFRVLFWGAALVLLIPLALLYRHALVGLRAAEDAQHQVVAERLVDTMENDLNLWLEREVNRPSHLYGRHTDFDAFVLAYFVLRGKEVEVHTPPLEATQALDMATVSKQVETIRAMINRTFITPMHAAGLKENPDVGKVAVNYTQRPGSTRKLAGPKTIEVVANNPDDTRQSQQWAQVYNSLDRNIELRNERSVLQSGDPGSMRPRLVDTQHMVLYRWTPSSTDSGLQGMVLDLPSLLDWLSERALWDDETARRIQVKQSLGDQSSFRPSRSALYKYQHRFSDPFADLAATISLKPLPGSGDGVYLSILTLLLAFTVIVGLTALYRMVAVQLQFAERRGNFVSSVSHELRTPLTAIRMYAEMLRDGVIHTDEKRDQYYDTISAEAERLSRLVNNVLELSRLEGRNRPMNMISADITKAVAETVDFMQPHAQKQGFVLELHAADDLPPVRFDRDAMTQVLFNLIDNSIKYARDAGNKNIVISCEKAAEGVRLGVRDYGPGIPKGQHTHLFEPFVRGENELTRRATGTGIGLALVKNLVESMGGRVRGVDPPGGGFEIYVLLEG